MRTLARSSLVAGDMLGFSDIIRIEKTEQLQDG